MISIEVTLPLGLEKHWAGELDVFEYATAVRRGPHISAVRISSPTEVWVRMKGQDSWIPIWAV